MSDPTWSLIVAPLVLILIAIPLVLRRIPPNGLYGLRVPATFKDERVWYDANAASARDMIVLAVVLLAFALVPPWLGWRGESHWLAWAVLLGAGAVAMAAVGWRRANRMLRQRLDENPPR